MHPALRQSRQFAAASLIAIAASLPLLGAEPPLSGDAALQELRRFDVVASVLHIAAHPDDENTQLIAYLARGRGYRTAYLSITRGDGGQNEIGPEFDEKLGVARTEELLAARRVDGGQQFFTRAIDFGYSKTPEETLRFWHHDEVLGDVVRVIRKFQPDVIVDRFPIPPGSGGHGHHTASGILGLEAFRLAGDPKAYPEQLTQGLTTWQPKRVAWNGAGQGVRGIGTVRMDIGGRDSSTGEAFSAIAGQSRSMHKTQGFGNFAGGGGRGGAGGPSEQTFTILGGDPAEKDLLDGIDTTWGRFPGGAEIARLTGQAIAAFDTNNLAKNVPALLAIHAKLAALPSTPVIDDKRAQFDRILQSCLGLSVETACDQPEVAPGDAVTFHATVTAKGEVKWAEARLRYPQTMAARVPALQPGSPATAALEFTVPADAPLSQPYWLREDADVGLYHVDDPRLIGDPESPPSFVVDYTFEVGGQKLVVSDAAKWSDTSGKKRRVDVIPPATLRFTAGVSLFTPGASHDVTVQIKAQRPNTGGDLQLNIPTDWKSVPSSQHFQLAKIGEMALVTFHVTAPANSAIGKATASATIHGRKYENQRIEINYAHLPFILLQPKAEAKFLSLDIATRGKNVGYLPGAGDDTAAALEQLGYAVTTLTGNDLTPDKLKGLDAVVIGVRAFNERNDFAPNFSNLLAYVENGGTVVAQYNRPNGLKTSRLGPYALSIQGPAPDLRVTDETAPVTILDTASPAVTMPNKIGPADFEGWFQERGAYFPSDWGSEYDSVLAMSDPGEAPLRGSLLVAKYGKGYYVYTGLAFFRQLPQGVPGAYRLFANLVSLGK